jgi:hypothetical protein
VNKNKIVEYLLSTVAAFKRTYEFIYKIKNTKENIYSITKKKKKVLYVTLTNT